MEKHPEVLKRLLMMLPGASRLCLCRTGQGKDGRLRDLAKETTVSLHTSGSGQMLLEKAMDGPLLDVLSSVHPTLAGWDRPTAPQIREKSQLIESLFSQVGQFHRGQSPYDITWDAWDHVSHQKHP